MNFTDLATDVCNCYDNDKMIECGFELFNDEVLDIQVYARETEEGGVRFVFRGTDSLTDWKSDFNIIKRVWHRHPDCGKVHGGFLKIYETARDFLVNRAEGARKIEITGHSLGGAVATLAAFDLAREGGDVEISTFGSPRVGNKTFAKCYNKAVPQTWRFVDPQDPIPRVPNLGYKHVAGMMTTTDGGYHAGYPAAYTIGICCVSPGEHSTENYLASIEKGEIRV